MLPQERGRQQFRLTNSALYPLNLSFTMVGSALISDFSVQPLCSLCLCGYKECAIQQPQRHTEHRGCTEKKCQIRSLPNGHSSSIKSLKSACALSWEINNDRCRQWPSQKMWWTPTLISPDPVETHC